MFRPESKCIFDDVRRERETRLVKNDGISATRLSVVFLLPIGVERGIVTSPHASIYISEPPARTMSSSAAGAFQWNSAGLLQMWISVAGSSVHEWRSG
jgi:hypothetical protein